MLISTTAVWTNACKFCINTFKLTEQHKLFQNNCCLTTFFTFSFWIIMMQSEEKDGIRQTQFSSSAKRTHHLFMCLFTSSVTSILLLWQSRKKLLLPIGRSHKNKANITGRHITIATQLHINIKKKSQKVLQSSSSATYLLTSNYGVIVK